MTDYSVTNRVKSNSNNNSKPQAAANQQHKKKVNKPVDFKSNNQKRTTGSKNSQAKAKTTAQSKAKPKAKAGDGFLAGLARKAGFNRIANFLREDWSGKQIEKVTGKNKFTNWLQNKDKVCTDGKNDGKLSFKEKAKSFAKGLVGGIPKAIINHPVATAVSVAVGAAAVVATGGAILPVMAAVGVAAGVGSIGYGTYKAATAKTDAEAKQAYETMGMGVTTTVLAASSANAAMEKAAEAGVKTAQVSENTNIISKNIQMIKSVPQALKTSVQNVKSNLSSPANLNSGVVAQNLKDTPALEQGTASKQIATNNSNLKPYQKPETTVNDLAAEEDLCSSSHIMLNKFHKSMGSNGAKASANGSSHSYRYRMSEKDYEISIINELLKENRAKTEGLRGMFNKIFDNETYNANLKFLDELQKDHYFIAHHGHPFEFNYKTGKFIYKYTEKYGK